MPLRIVICLKQVPNPDLQFQVNEQGTDIKREGLNYRIGGTDEYALEEAVRLKEKHGGSVTAITVGPKRSEQMLRESLAKGADQAVRVAYEDQVVQDPGKVARIIAAAANLLTYDIILTGVQSDDLVNSVTGGLIAGTLGIPHASVVAKVEIRDLEASVGRELEGGDLEVISFPLPALLTIQYGINVPRYAPLPAIMRAARAPIKELQPSDLGVRSWDDFAAGVSYRVARLALPETHRRAEMIDGGIEEQTRKLAQLLREKGFVRGA